MKDWFYASGSEIVCAESKITKSRLIKSIKSGHHSIRSLNQHLGTIISPDEVEDVKYLIKIYGPMSYNNLSGCSGCGGCTVSKDFSLVED